MNRTTLATVSVPAVWAMSMPSTVRGSCVEVQDLLQAGQPLLGIDGKDLRLHVLVELAALVERLQEMDLVAEPGRLFELELLRGRLHLRPHLVQQGLLLAFQELLQAMDALAVVLLRDPQIAGGRALPDRGQQAGPEPPPARIFLGNVQRAGAELEDLLQDLQGAAQAAGIGERPVELRAAVAGRAGDFHAGKFLVRVDFQVGKGLVVAEVAIVFRQDVLDQPGFHQEGVDVAFRQQVVDVADFLHQLGRAGVFGGRLEKIAAGAARRFLALPI